MPIGTSNFPQSIDSLSDLVEAANDATTTLTASITSTATTIPVTSASSFPGTGIIRIGSELIAYSSRTATQFNVQASGRGYESTTPATAASGATVELVITAAGNNVKSAAIVALQTKIGYGSTNPNTAGAGTFLKSTGFGASSWDRITTADTFGYQSRATTSASTLTLWSFSSYHQFFTGTENQTVTLPVTSTLSTGHSFEMHNNSTGTVTVNSSGGNLVATVAGGQTAKIVCIQNSGTTNTSWDVTYYGSGGAARNIWIPASAWIPRTTSGCGVDSREIGSTNRQNFDELLFDATTDEFAQALQILPGNYNNGTIAAYFYWTAGSGSGNVVWAIQARAFADDDPLDSAFGTVQSVTDTLIVANDMHVSPVTSAVTIGGTPLANRPIQFQISRDADSASDTLTADARLLGVEIVFTAT